MSIEVPGFRIIETEEDNDNQVTYNRQPLIGNWLWSIDYGSQSVKCRYPKCDKNIDQNTLRIARCVPNPYRPGSVTKLYKHISCTFDEFKQVKKGDARSFFKSPDELHGWDNIQHIDQEHVKCLIYDLLEYRGIDKKSKDSKYAKFERRPICLQGNDSIGKKASKTPKSKWFEKQLTQKHLPTSKKSKNIQRIVSNTQKKARENKQIRKKRNVVISEPIIFDATIGHCARTLPYNDFPGIKYSTRLPNGLRVHLPRNKNVNFNSSKKKNAILCLNSEMAIKQDANDVGMNYNDSPVEVTLFSPFAEKVDNQILTPNNSFDRTLDENNNILSNPFSSDIICKSILIELFDGLILPCSSKSITCCKCTFSVSTESAENLVLHMLDKHQQKLFVCPACPNSGEFSYSINPIKRHIFFHHEGVAQELIENINLQAFIMNDERSSIKNKKDEIQKGDCITESLLKECETSKIKASDFQDFDAVMPTNGAGDIEVDGNIDLDKNCISEETKFLVDIPKCYVIENKIQSDKFNFTCCICMNCFDLMWYLERHWLTEHSKCYSKERN